MKQESFSILFYILRTRLLKNGEAPIKVRITIDGVSDEANIKRSIPVKKWNQSKGLSKGNDRSDNELNDYIEDLNTSIKQIYKEMVKDGEFYNPSIILKKSFSIDRKIRTVLSTFKEHNEECRRLIDSGKYAYSTVNRYDNCLVSLTKVIKQEYKKDDISFNEFTGEVIHKYEMYLRIEKNLSENTLVRYMKAIKKICNLAISNGWMKVDPFAGKKFKQPRTYPVFLTMDEIDTIANKEFTIERLDLVRDVFLFCCYTGLAFIDVANLTRENIVRDNKGSYWIYKTRCKTNVKFNVPLLELPLSIIEKYKDHPMCKSKGIILPVMCNRKMNSYLKETADI